MITYDIENIFGFWCKLRPKDGSTAVYVLPHMFIASLISSLAYLLTRLGVVEKWHLVIDSQFHKFVAPTVMLLVIFRSSLSFGRYWQGRGAAGLLVKVLRDTHRQSALYIAKDHHDQASAASIRSALGFYLNLFFVLTKIHLRKGEEELSSIEGTVTSEEYAYLTNKRKCKRPALTVASWISLLLRQSFDKNLIKETEYIAMDNNVGELIGAFNGLDKIRYTQIPFPYAQLLLLGLSIYTFTLPASLVDSLEWKAILVSPLVAFALFSINEVSLQIEDPFGLDPNDLPIDKMVQAVKDDGLTFALVNQVNDGPGRRFSFRDVNFKAGKAVTTQV